LISRRIKGGHVHAGQRKLSNSNAFKRNELIGDTFELTDRSLNKQDLDAIIVLELDVKRTDHFVDMEALQLR
jgi:hypothetical protein